MAVPLSKLDMAQVIRSSYDDLHPGALKFIDASSLVPREYDEIDLSYTGADLTGVVYKSAGSTVATLVLSYFGGNLVSVVRS